MVFSPSNKKSLLISNSSFSTNGALISNAFSFPSISAYSNKNEANFKAYTFFVLSISDYIF